MRELGDVLAKAHAALDELESSQRAHAEQIARLEADMVLDDVVADDELPTTELPTVIEASPPKPVGPPVEAVTDLADGASACNFDRRHVEWALHEILAPAEQFGYELVGRDERAGHEVVRRPLGPGTWCYRRMIPLRDVPPEVVTRYLTTCVDSCESVQALVNAITKTASSRSCVTIRPVASPEPGRRIVTHWHTYIGPMISDREMTIFEQLIRHDDELAVDGTGAGLCASAHALLLCASGEHQSAPAPAAGSMGANHYTAQLILDDGQGGSIVRGCYYVDLRPVPSLFISAAARTLGTASNDALIKWVREWHSNHTARGG